MKWCDPTEMTRWSKWEENEQAYVLRGGRVMNAERKEIKKKYWCDSPCSG